MSDKLQRRDLLSTGSTLLNLACSGNPMGGFLKGKFYYVVGDSASGKTLLSMTCFAEAAHNGCFDDYRLIFDNAEGGMEMDLDNLFSERVADRIEPPAKNGDEPIYSDTIETFYFHLEDALNAKQPCIYILDSMDALFSKAAEEKFKQQKRAYQKSQGKDEGEEEEKVAGSYGDGKAKKNSEFLRRAVSKLRKTGSILIILSQTRDNIGSMYGGKTHAGGRALRFYCTTEIWTSIVKVLKRNVRGKDREIGVKAKAEVKKNRITGRLARVVVDIYPEIGIDDIGSCIDYLVEEGFWITNKNTIAATGLGLQGTREKIIRQIEKQGLERPLRKLCGDCWKQVQEACSLNRKRRYAEVDE